MHVYSIVILELVFHDKVIYVRSPLPIQLLSEHF